MSVVPMTKITLVTLSKDVDSVLKNMQNLGIVHVVPIESKSKSKDIYSAETDEELSCVRSSLKELRKTLSVIQDLKKNHVNFSVAQETETDVLSKSIEFNKYIELINEKNTRISNLKNSINEIKVWGNFSVEDMKSISGKIGFNISLGIIDKEKLSRINSENLFFEKIYENDNKIYALFIHKNDKINADMVFPPDQSLDKLQEIIEDEVSEVSKIRQMLTPAIAFEQSILDGISKLERSEERLEAKRNISHFEHICGFEGFLPSNKKELLKTAFLDQNVAIKMSSPQEQDSVPLLLKNSNLFSGFETILKLFSGLSYHEKDVTPIIGVLFMVFGSLCLVDVGYGLLTVFLGLMLIKYRMKDLGCVCLLTGMFTTLMGVLNGQIFGLLIGKDILKGVEPIMDLAADPLYCFSFSLMVGVAAVFSSYVTAIWKNGLETDASGSLVLTCGIILYILGDKCSIEESVNGWVLAIATLLAFLLWIQYPIIIFDTKIPNIIWTLYSGVTGLIQDILSHMRLFGISLSGAILAIVVNEISCIFPFYIQIPFCIVGHIFVFALSLLSLYVHTNRLIFYEFGSKCIVGGDYYYLPLGRS